MIDSKRLIEKIDNFTYVKNNIHFFINDKGENPSIFEKIDRNVSLERNAVPLRMLDINNNQIGIYFGCDSFELIDFVANSCSLIIIVDSVENLIFFNNKLDKTQKNKIILLSEFSTELKTLNECFDFAIINPSYYRHLNKRSYSNLLKISYQLLKNNGKLFFSINNCLNYNNWISIIPFFLFKNSLLSYSSHIKLLIEEHFKMVNTYIAFPNKDFPNKIFLFSEIKKYKSDYYILEKNTILLKFMRKIKLYIDKVIFDIFKLSKLSPSFITIAKK